ncbi:acyl-CoA reductase [Lysobacter sp. MMG2]|uniref:acyl-CoA reductase n=1 Tax=Lysobacter sp. MMG2 TaxID=2801338 RepID=UPI001C221DED|nr:acyl-CoA reductase [Lysobacter sp. MMG2]MBU8975643.1 acyl-CoA reductase [Lysobacter sp. MMG2]
MTTFLFSSSADPDLSAQLKRLRTLGTLQPFSHAATEFVGDFSRRVLKLPQLRAHPELATLAHWFRPAGIAHLERRASAVEGNRILARGLVFHLAPANVDVLFAYAWLMSVLSGNANVARLSQKPSAQRDALIGILGAMREEGLHAEVLDRTILLTYPHDAAITAQLSSHCHARIVWGGDSTVRTIRAIPLPPLAVELAFPDRFGVAAISAAALDAVGEDDLQPLARRFANDILWFGQQACSSPRCLYWIGDHETIARAKSRLWRAVREDSARFEDEAAALMSRVTDAHLLAALGHAETIDGGFASFPIRLQAAHSDGDVRELQSGNGLVVEVELPSLADMGAQLDDRDQTLVQFGFDSADIDALLAQLRGRAIDRVVPFGRALDFHHVWDGTDLFSVLRRQVTLASV